MTKNMMLQWGEMPTSVAYIGTGQIMGWGNKAIEIRSVETGHLDGVFMHKKAQKLKFLCERNDKVSRVTRGGEIWAVGRKRLGRDRMLFICVESVCEGAHPILLSDAGSPGILSVRLLKSHNIQYIYIMQGKYMCTNEWMGNLSCDSFCK